MRQFSSNVTVVLTSCGRQDLLEVTLDSFLQYNTFPIHDFIIIEDGPGDRNLDLIEKYRRFSFEWLCTGTRVGQIAAIDMAYRTVGTDYIFHCEDDWKFTAPGFKEKWLPILEACTSILQVYLRAFNDTQGHPVSEEIFTAQGVPYRCLVHHYDAGLWGVWHARLLCGHSGRQ
jgi:hypothetical protein